MNLHTSTCLPKVTALRRSAETFGKQVLVCKFIPGELDIAG